MTDARLFPSIILIAIVVTAATILGSNFGLVPDNRLVGNYIDPGITNFCGCPLLAAKSDESGVTYGSAIFRSCRQPTGIGGVCTGTCIYSGEREIPCGAVYGDTPYTGPITIRDR